MTSSGCDPASSAAAPPRSTAPRARRRCAGSARTPPPRRAATCGGVRTIVTDDAFPATFAIFAEAIPAPAELKPVLPGPHPLKDHAGLPCASSCAPRPSCSPPRRSAASCSCCAGRESGSPLDRAFLAAFLLAALYLPLAAAASAANGRSRWMSEDAVIPVAGMFLAALAARGAEAARLTPALRRRLSRPVQPERLGEEHGHLPARQRRIRAVVPAAAAGGDPRGDERLDVRKGAVGLRHVRERRRAGGGLTWRFHWTRTAPRPCRGATARARVGDRTDHSVSVDVRRSSDGVRDGIRAVRSIALGSSSPRRRGGVAPPGSPRPQRAGSPRARRSPCRSGSDRNSRCTRARSSRRTAGPTERADPGAMPSRCTHTRPLQWSFRRRLAWSLSSSALIVRVWV